MAAVLIGMLGIVGVSAAAVDPARLVFLIEYVGSDYANAVRDGRVVNQFEYDEVVRFTREVLGAYADVPKPDAGVAAELQALERLILEHGPVDAVGARAREVAVRLAAALGVAADASSGGEASRGAAVWKTACVPCHGARGDGDGPEAASLHPPPAPLRGAGGRTLSRRQIYGAVTYGIDGTAMASFRDVYDDQQRRDVAAFVESLAATSSDAAATTDAGGDDDGLAVALQLQDTFARIAARAQPSVVGVTSFVEDPAWTLERLTAEHGSKWIQARAEELQFSGYRKVRAGSGFLVSDDGHLLSANHLVRDDVGEVVPVVSVELRDGRHVKARVVGSEPTIDLAVLQLMELTDPAERAVAPLPLGDSARAQVGHWVIAVGDPPGAEVTYAVGTLAARPERECYQEDLSRTLFQTSLYVSPASYGGPVLDIQGRAIGMTIPRPGGGLDLAAGAERGPAFALPIDLALTLFEALKVAESNRSPWVGISVLELSSAQRLLAREGRMPALPDAGVYIDAVYQPSPASRAGVRAGDFLVAMGIKRVRSVADFQKSLYLAGIGTPIELELWRAGKAVKGTVPIEVRPADAATR